MTNSTGHILISHNDDELINCNPTHLSDVNQFIIDARAIILAAHSRCWNRTKFPIQYLPARRNNRPIYIYIYPSLLTICM